MKGEKMTITWERFVTRPANEQDMADELAHREQYGRPLYDQDLKLGDELDVEEAIELPAKYEVCGRCGGKGSHVNPSIDGHGITMDEWYGPDWDEGSRADYMSGVYDVGCYECGGKRVVLGIDEDRCDKQLLKDYYKAMDEKARDDYADRRMRWAEDGCRGSFDEY